MFRPKGLCATCGGEETRRVLLKSRYRAYNQAKSLCVVLSNTMAQADKVKMVGMRTPNQDMITGKNKSESAEVENKMTRKKL